MLVDLISARSTSWILTRTSEFLPFAYVGNAHAAASLAAEREGEEFGIGLEAEPPLLVRHVQLHRDRLQHVGNRGSRPLRLLC